MSKDETSQSMSTLLALRGISAEQFEAELREAVAKTERQVAEIEKSRRVSQELMQTSFCNCKDGRCGRGSR